MKKAWNFEEKLKRGREGVQAGLWEIVKKETSGNTEGQGGKWKDNIGGEKVI